MEDDREVRGPWLWGTCLWDLNRGAFSSYNEIMYSQINPPKHVRELSGPGIPLERQTNRAVATDLSSVRNPWKLDVGGGTPIGITVFQ